MYNEFGIKPEIIELSKKSRTGNKGRIWKSWKDRRIEYTKSANGMPKI